jgi:hypothetical protein
VRFISAGQAQNSDSHKPPTSIIQKINQAKNDAMSHLVSFFPQRGLSWLKASVWALATKLLPNTS